LICLQLNVLLALCPKVTLNEQLIIDQRGQDSVIALIIYFIESQFQVFLYNQALNQFIINSCHRWTAQAIDYHIPIGTVKWSQRRRLERFNQIT